MSTTIARCPACGSVQFPHFCPTAVPMPKRPHRCPVCSGCGTVPADFYHQLGVATSTNRETCRGCGGNGVIVA